MKYRFSVNVDSDFNMEESVIIELGVELHRCIDSFLRSKRIKAYITDKLDISEAVNE